MGKRTESTAVLEQRPATVDTPQAVAPSREVEVDSLAEQLGREEIAFQKAAERIFDRPQETWTPGDWAILRRVGPRPGGTPSHDRNAVNEWLAKNTGRLRTVREFQQRAGSPGDREAARQLAAETAAKLATEGPQIEAEMARLQSQLATLASDAKQAGAAVERREAAVAALQEESRLPSYVLDELHAASRRHAAEFRSELAQARGRLRGIEAVLAIDPESPDGANSIRLHVESNVGLGGDSVSRLQRFFETRESSGEQTSTREISVRKVRLPEWAAYCRTLESEAAEIKTRIEQLLPLEQAAAAELERLRSFYVPE